MSKNTDIVDVDGRPTTEESRDKRDDCDREEESRRGGGNVTKNMGANLSCPELQSP